MTDLRYDVVVPTVGRPSLVTLLDALVQGDGPAPERVLVVDDRRDPSIPLELGGRDATVLRGASRGPGAARNVGWRAARSPWTAFLDDDVVPGPGWRVALVSDLGGLADDVGASQGRVRVPLPPDRRLTDWERNVAGLETARWATADMAYRRTVLAEVGGFDERFPRAYREDADLALRVLAAGHRIVQGRRQVLHPPGPPDPAASVRLQAGNADDALMRALHGNGWRAAAGAPKGRRSLHLIVTAAGLTAVASLVARRRRVAAVAGAAWSAGTAELALARIAPGPRTAQEVATMVVTSAAIPPAATWHWTTGLARARRLSRATSPRAPSPAAVLFDRDGTLVVDVPYNGDPDRVVPMPGAREALDRLRAAGVPVGMVSNQSGVARGLLTMEQVERVNQRVEELLGPLGPWAVCPHGPDDGCGCRKPAKGLIVEAARSLGVDAGRCAVVGDIGADVDAARAAGARGILVPTPATRPEEVAAAPEVAPDLPSAVELLMSWPGGRR